MLLQEVLHSGTALSPTR